MPFRGLSLRRRKSKDASSSSEQIQSSHVFGLPYEDAEKADSPIVQHPPMPNVQIMRSTTYSQELLTAPSFDTPKNTMPVPTPPESKEKESKVEQVSVPKRSNTTKSTKGKRLSTLLHINRRTRAVSAADISTMPPPFLARGEDEKDSAATTRDLSGKSEEERQKQWEKRATLLVQDTTNPVTLPPSPGPPVKTPEKEKTSYEFTRPPESGTQQDSDWPLRSHEPSPRKSNAGVSHGVGQAGLKHNWQETEMVS